MAPPSANRLAPRRGHQFGLERRDGPDDDRSRGAQVGPKVVEIGGDLPGGDVAKGPQFNDGDSVIEFDMPIDLGVKAIDDCMGGGDAPVPVRPLHGQHAVRSRPIRPARLQGLPNTIIILDHGWWRWRRQWSPRHVFSVSFYLARLRIARLGAVDDAAALRGIELGPKEKHADPNAQDQDGKQCEKEPQLALHR